MSYLKGLLVCCLLAGSLSPSAVGQIQFAPPVQYNLQHALPPNSAFSFQVPHAGDLNGDGRPDIVVGVFEGIAVMLNKGDGTFLNPIVYGPTVGAGPFAGALIDLNNDGHLDMVGLTDQGSYLYFFLNKGDGSFSPSVQVTLPGAFRGKSMTAGDFNGDGRVDLAVAYVDSGLNPQTVILVNNGDGTLSPTYTISAPGAGDCCGDADLIAAPDLNGDGLADLVLYTGQVAVMLNLGNGQFASAVYYSGSRYDSFTYLYFADLNGDGSPDVVTGDLNYAFDFGLLPGGGQLPATLAGVDQLGDQHVAPLAIADFDNKGGNDVVVLADQLLMFSNGGDANFASPISQSLPYPYYRDLNAIADFNGDGLLDIAVCRPLPDGTVTIDILRNTTPTTGGSIAVSGVFPPQGGNSGTVSGVNIIGTGFPSDVQVKLTGPGPEIVPTSITVSTAGNLIAASFNLNGAAPGSYALVLTDSKGNVLLTKPAAFTVQQGGAPDVWVDLVGWTRLRAGQPQTFYALAGNQGNIDANSIAGSIAIPTPLTVDDSSIPFILDTYTSSTDGEVVSFILPTISAGGVQPVPVKLTAPTDPGLAHYPFTIRTEAQSIPTSDSVAGAAKLSTSPISSSSGLLGTGLVGLLYGPPLYDGCGKPTHKQCPGCEPQWNNVQTAETITINESLNSQKATLKFLTKAAEIANDIAATSFMSTVAGPALGEFVAEAITEKVTLGTGIDFVVSSITVEAFNYFKKAFYGGGLNDPSGSYNAAITEARDYGQAIAVFTQIVKSNGVVQSRRLVELGNSALTAMTTTEDAIDTLIDAWPELTILWNERNDARSKYAYDNNTYLCGEVNSYLSCLNGQCGGGTTTLPTRSGPGATLTGEIIESGDPNDKAGSQGVGPQQYIAAATPLRYAVAFENEKTASAPAARVAVTDPLDAENDDLSTIVFGPIGFLKQTVLPPQAPGSFSTVVDLRPANNLLLAIDAHLDAATHSLIWTFQSLDPTTHQPPADPSAGFLPPGTGGDVFFTVMPKHGLPTNTQIRNQASIVFDVNAAIPTPTWTNTLDSTPATSHAIPLPPTESNTSFPVSWSGTDVGAGVQDFTVFASDNGAPFTVWQQNLAATSANFTGQVGHTYSFYSIAHDLVGNVEAGKTSAEATTTVATATDTTPPVITITTPTNGATYSANQLVKAAYACTDAGSGVATCTGTVPSGNNIDTAPSGVSTTKTFAVQATDVAGNPASKSVSYAVSCHYVGLGISPSTVARGGKITVTGTVMSCTSSSQTVSVKFTLTGPLGPKSCANTSTVMFTSPPFTIAAGTKKTISFPFAIPKSACAGQFIITTTTLMGGTPVDSSSATLTVQ